MLKEKGVYFFCTYGVFITYYSYLFEPSLILFISILFPFSLLGLSAFSLPSIFPNFSGGGSGGVGAPVFKLFRVSVDPLIFLVGYLFSFSIQHNASIRKE